jgi:ATP-dependent DNA helicase RecG
MYTEMIRLGHEPPLFEADLEQVRVVLLGGAPNAQVARFVASLPSEEAKDADTMLVLLYLMTHLTATAEQLASLLQKPVPETQAVLRRVESPPVDLVERTRESARRAHPTYRLREHAVAALGSALAYHRRSPDQSDRKVIGVVAESGEINARGAVAAGPRLQGGVPAVGRPGRQGDSGQDLGSTAWPWRDVRSRSRVSRQGSSTAYSEARWGK